MQKIKSVAAAALSWLTSKRHLSDHTMASYEGELRRFAEFLQIEGVTRVSDLTEVLWTSYLESKRSERVPTNSSRGQALSKASINQAGRITRAFLEWAHDEELLKWRPRSWHANRVEVREDRIGALPLLGPALCGRIQVSTEDEYRALLALNLMFWACLNSAALATLSVSALHWVRPRELALRTLDDGRGFVFLPKHLWAIWMGYQETRAEDRNICPDAPLLARLDDGKELSAWSVWLAVRRFQEEHLKLQAPLTPRQLSRLFMGLAAQAQNPLKTAFLDHSGRSSYLMKSAAVFGESPRHVQPEFRAALTKVERSIRSA